MPEAPTLDSIVDQAASELGLDLNQLDVPPGLAIACAAYEAAPRTDISDISFVSNAVRRLRNEHAIGRVQPRPSEVPPATVIFGLPRTGSTLLHNLLALEPGAGVPTHAWCMDAWDVIEGRPEAAVRDAEDRLELVDLIGPAIRDRHPMSSTWPDECTLLFENFFSSHQLPIVYGLPGYFDWLRDEPSTDRYRRYRASLDVMRSVLPPVHRLVLKSPFHVLDLEALGAVLPSVSPILTVRDPRAVYRSWMELCRASSLALYGSVGPADSMAGRWASLLGDMAVASVAASESSSVEVVVFDELAAAPAAVASKLIERQGRAVDQAYRGRIDSWLDLPEAGRRGLDCGVDLPELPPEVADVFDLYREHFALGEEGGRR